MPLARHLLRVRDLIDRAYAERLDVDALARSAWVSPSYFRRSFKAAFGETPPLRRGTSTGAISSAKVPSFWAAAARWWLAAA